MRLLNSYLAILCWVIALQSCSCYSVTSPPIIVKGSAAKPYEKKKVAVFGGGGYLGACIYGFLQRAGSLYGTGIAGIGAPRSISATAVGSASLNAVLGKNFILAQADESFVKLTNMTSVASIQSRVKGFDVAVMATRYTLETRPVTGGSYEQTPNDKTFEFYMDKPRSSTFQGLDDPDYSFALLQRTLEACSKEGVKRVVVIETDAQFDAPRTSDGNKCVELLEKCGIPYLYVQPVGPLENFRDYTYAKGVQGSLDVAVIQPGNLGPSSAEGNAIYREDLAAFCVQCILSLDWIKSGIIQVKSTGTAEAIKSDKPPSQEWCVNSNLLGSLLSRLAQ